VNDDDARRVHQFIQAGASPDDAARVCGFTPNELAEYREDNPEFDEELENTMTNLRVLAAGYVRQSMKDDVKVAERYLLQQQTELRLARLRELTTDEGQKAHPD
jgi:cytidylate kinase